MGTPIKIDVKGRPVFICCEGCRDSLLEEPEKYLALLANRQATDDSPESVPEINLPPMGILKIVEPAGGLPPVPEGGLLPTEISQPTITRSTKSPPPPSRPTKRVTRRSQEGVR